MTNSNCTTPYSQGPTNSNLTLHCKVTKRSSSTLFINIQNASGWTTCRLYMIGTNGGPSTSNPGDFQAKLISGTTYRVEIPTDYGFVINNNKWSAGGYSDQSIDIILASTQIQSPKVVVKTPVPVK